MVNPKALEGCLRCHECRLVPDAIPTADSQGNPAWELRCALHGHVAMGADLDEAVKHWNIYIHFKLTGEVLHE